MDPLDRLSIPTPQMNSADAQSSSGDVGPNSGLNPGASSDGSSDASAVGYGHVPFTQMQAGPSPAARTQVRRDVFWNNVVREILMALSSAAAASSGRLGTGPSAAQSSTSPVDELFDGRMGLITTLGQRIPIAAIMPVFSCSMPAGDADKSRSNDVQCTVYRVTTPTGESYTLPISQIIGVHSLSDSLVEQLERAEVPQEVPEEDRVPFGFAAYTSLAQSEDDEQGAAGKQ